MPQGYEIPILIVLVLLVFGSSQIPKLAKNLGRAQKEFKDGIAEGHRDASKSSDKSDDQPADASSKDSKSES